MGRLVLHPEKRRVPARLGKNLRQCSDAGTILPTVVRQPDQAIALRVTTGEQRPARRGAQWRGGMCPGQQNALGGQPIQLRAGYIGVPVDPEIPA